MKIESADLSPYHCLMGSIIPRQDNKNDKGKMHQISET